MKVAVFDTHRFERPIFESANAVGRHDLTFFEHCLTEQSAKMADGFSAVCAFVNDQLNANVLRVLHRGGVRLLALRSAGFNHVDLKAAAASAAVRGSPS